MIYLKKFNENNNLSIQEYCENYLAYLIDEGLVIHINSEKSVGFVNIVLRLNSYWDNCKNTIIPFIEIINNDYGIVGSIFITFGGIYQFDFSLNDIVNDKVIDTENTYQNLKRSHNKVTVIDFYIKI